MQSMRDDIMHLSLQLEDAKAEILELYKLVDMLVRREAERVPEPEVAERTQMQTPTTSRTMDNQRAASPSWKQQDFVVDNIKVEVSPMRSVVGGYFGGDNLQLPLVTTSSSSSPESVRIAAFGTGAQGHHSPSRPQMMVTGATPALLALQANMKTPFFDGDEKKWPLFTRDWQRYVAYMLLGAPEGVIGDVWKRDLLINCLHNVLGKRYQSLVLAKPGLLFADIWRDLEKHFAIDDPHHWRAQWEQVELQHIGDVIRLKDWLFFQAEFEAAKTQVSDWTEQEEIDVLLKKLPAGWRTKVPREEAKESKRKFAVKIVGSSVGGEKLRAIMTQLDVRVKKKSRTWPIAASFR